MNRGILSQAVLLIGFCLGSAANAATGPTQTPLKITAMYTKDANGAIYVTNHGITPGAGEVLKIAP